MLTRTFIEKTLLDLGEMAVDEGQSPDSVWQLYACLLPQLTATLKGESVGGDIFASVVLEFDDTRFQKQINEIFPQLVLGRGSLCIKTRNEFEKVCSQILRAIRALPPDYDANDFHEFDPAIDDQVTEAEAVVKERRGQAKYRKRLEKLWESCCAVTGVSIPEVLRASHAKPWKACASGRERLDPYNGFLLSANLDALFDKYLITFEDNGDLLCSPVLDREQLASLGIQPHMKLRWVDQRHLEYLQHHRAEFLKKADSQK